MLTSALNIKLLIVVLVIVGAAGAAVAQCNNGDVITVDTISQVQKCAPRNALLTKAEVGLSAVDNTSDAGKPVSTATQAALNAKLDASVLTGMVAIRLTACPAGWSEVAALNGITLVGTLAANGNAGTTGGADSVTPVGTVSAPTFSGNSVASSSVSAGTPAGTNSAPTFTGSALATHAHELPFQKVAGGTGVLRILAPATFGTGTSRAAESQEAAPAANATSAAVALSQAVSAGTPAGTVSAPVFTGNALGTHSHTTTATGTNSAPVFTGTAFDNRSAFVRVIFCSKN